MGRYNKQMTGSVNEALLISSHPWITIFRIHLPLNRKEATFPLWVSAKMEYTPRYDQLWPFRSGTMMKEPMALWISLKPNVIFSILFLWFYILRIFLKQRQWHIGHLAAGRQVVHLSTAHHAVPFAPRLDLSPCQGVLLHQVFDTKKPWESDYFGPMLKVDLKRECCVTCCS